MATLRRPLVDIVRELEVQEPILVNSGVVSVVGEVSSFDLDNMRFYDQVTRGLEEGHSSMDSLLRYYSRRLVAALCFKEYAVQENDPGLNIRAAVTWDKAGRNAFCVSNRAGATKGKWIVRTHLCRRRAAEIYNALEGHQIDRLYSLVFAADSALYLLEGIRSGGLSLKHLPEGYRQEETIRAMLDDSLTGALVIFRSGLRITRQPGGVVDRYIEVLGRYRGIFGVDFVNRARELEARA